MFDVGDGESWGGVGELADDVTMTDCNLWTAVGVGDGGFRTGG